jgi:beta-1,4-mannosyl-glycoprotein beta-1,4-N-acetylglucosaminyltransferase
MRHRFIIDCFIFFNELKLLHFRLEELYDYVDYFVLVESTKSFTGNDKELVYQNNKHLFEKYRDKIIHVIVDDVDMPDAPDSSDDPTKSGTEWTREKYQRNQILRGLKKLNLNLDDTVLICDVDEIPSRECIRTFRFNKVEGLYVLYFESYIYSLRTKVMSADPYTRISTGARSLDYQSLLDFGTVDKARNTFSYNREFYPNGAKNNNEFAWIILNAGWHFTYFGDKEFIIKKIKNFSHQEINNDYLIENLDSIMDSGIFITNEYPTQQVEIETNPRLPFNYKMLL